MNKFFELRDDMLLPGRWHLDDPETDEGCEPYDFRRGVPLSIHSTPNIAIKIGGIPLDFTLTLLDVPVVGRNVAEVFSKIAGADIQRIPATVDSRPGYEIINVCRLIKCLDERLTTSFAKWMPEDERPDRLGRYRNVINLMIDSQLVPSSTHLFRIEGWDIPIIASLDLMEALLSVGAVGPKFTPVS